MTRNTVGTTSDVLGRRLRQPVSDAASEHPSPGLSRPVPRCARERFSMRYEAEVPTVVETATSDQLQVTLRRTSTLSVLLHDVFQAALDVSLKATDRTLYKRIEGVTRQRNNIVHEGRSQPTPEIRGRAALVASDLFAWLNRCLTPPTTPS